MSVHALLEDWKDLWCEARGKVVALFFYPGDETPVCAKSRKLQGTSEGLLALRYSMTLASRLYARIAVF